MIIFCRGFFSLLDDDILVVVVVVVVDVLESLVVVLLLLVLLCLLRGEDLTLAGLDPAHLVPFHQQPTIRTNNNSIVPQDLTH